jgi:hypothetical protein
VEEKLELNNISPSGVQIESFLRDKDTNVINGRKKQRIDSVKKVQSVTPTKSFSRSKEGVFRAQKAVEKLKNENRHDLAAFSLALDSQREMERSKLVPMAPPYQKVTDYLT